MILLTDISFFQKPIEIVNLNEPNSVVKDDVSHFIRMYEPELLQDVLGLELYTALQSALLVNPLADNFQKLLFGDSYTNSYGRLAKWKGIIETDTSYFTSGAGLIYKTPEWITVGETTDAEGVIIIPVEATSFLMPGWVGWQPIITRMGAGILQPDVDYTFDGTIGAVALMQGDNFQKGERLFVQFQLPTRSNLTLITPNSNEVRKVEWTSGVTKMPNGNLFPAGINTFTNPDWIGWEVEEFHNYNSIYKRGRDYTYDSLTGTLTKIKVADVFELNTDYAVSLKRGAVIDANIAQGSVSYKHSFIANYVYFYYMRNNATFSTGIGEKKVSTGNTTDASAGHKMISAWNDMINILNSLWCYLDSNRDTYPEWYGRSRDSWKYRTINAFGI